MESTFELDSNLFDSYDTLYLEDSNGDLLDIPWDVLRNNSIINGTDADLGSVYESKQQFRTNVVVLTLFILIFLVGVFGNVSVVYVVGCYKQMQNVTNMYLVNISIAQLIYLTVCLPTLTATYAFSEWKFGEAFCK